MTVKKNSTPPEFLPKEEEFSKMERASNLPKPSQFRITNVPLDLLIQYYYIHDIRDRAYVHSKAYDVDVMICSKTRPDDEPLAHYIENPT